MKITLLALLALSPGLVRADEGNSKIDYAGFLELARDIQPVREKNRVSEEQFLRMTREAGTVILDTRSKAKFDKIHVQGALHLNFSDFSAEALKKLIPDRSTRILIYCNNNFEGEPVHLAEKRSEAALNIPTFLHLHAYGYKNVFELGPKLDINKTRIPFAGQAVKPPLR